MSSGTNGIRERDAKSNLYSIIRNVTTAREPLGLTHLDPVWLHHVAKSVSAADCAAGKPYYYGRVDDTAEALGITERTHLNIVNRLVAAGLIENRTLGNGHRGARRNADGALEYAHAILLAPLLERAEEIAALAEQVRAEKRAYSKARRQVKIARACLDRQLKATSPSPALSELRSQAQAILDAVPPRLLRRKLSLADLMRITAELESAADALQQATQMAADQLDTPENPNSEHQNFPISPAQISDNNNNTNLLLSSCTRRTPPDGDEELCSERPNGRKESLENERGGEAEECKSQIAQTQPPSPPKRSEVGKQADPNADLADVTIPRFLRAAPERWREAIEDIPNIDWRVIDMVACVRRAELGVSESAWSQGVAAMGAGRAALALMILDRNQDHPKRPVRSVGGAFVAMTRRFQSGALDLATSFQGVLHRPQGGQSAFH